MITVSHPSSTNISDSISDSFENVGKFLGIWDLLGIPHTVEDEAILNVTKFGSFTANFKELPSPVPPEFWLQSYVLVNIVIAGFIYTKHCRRD